MNPDEFKQRTRTFALRVVRLVNALPNSRTATVLGKQLLRCGTSVGANYRSACRARSRADSIAKMGIVEEECDESLYWMGLLIESGDLKAGLVEDLIQEANEILSMVMVSINTARARKESAIRNPKSAMKSGVGDVA
jgi:four helix bundle protein